jgi:hypothetical protein
MPHDNTERVGVNAVEAIFLGFKWTFRPQVISDYGIDAQVEVWEHEKFTGKHRRLARWSLSTNVLGS